MLKKILSLTFVVAVVLVLLTVGVSAAEYLNQDFENGINVFVNDNPPEGAARVGVTEGDNTAVFFDNPTGATLLSRINASVQTLPKGGVMMFDFKKGEKVDNGYIYVELNGGKVNDVSGKCVLNLAGVSHDEDKWYSYIMTMNEGCTEGMVYRKLRDSDEPYTFLVNAGIATTGEATAMWRMYCLKHSGYFDNIRIFSGIFAADSVFTVDGAEVEKLSDITGGIFNAKTNIICGQVKKEMDESGKFVAKGTSVTPVIVFFDKNMRMISCTQVEAELAVGDNEVLIDVDTTSFADRLNGGFAGLYILDDMMGIRPLADATELR